MKKIKKILDCFFTAFVVFLVVATWCNFHFRSIKKTFIPAIFITGAVMLIIYVLTFKLKRNHIQKNKTDKEAKQTIENFLFYSKKKQTEMLKTAYSLKNSLSNKLILIELDSASFASKEILNAVVEATDKNKKHIVCFCNCANKEAILESKRYVDFNFEFVDYLQIYELFLEAKIKVEKLINIKEQKINIKQFFELLISKERSKHYFYIAIFLSITCFFTPFKIYYAIFTTLFFILAIVSRFKKPSFKNVNA